jgi:hypothetical protein
MKLKHRIETWLKRLIAEEVEKIDRDLRGERAALRAQIATCDGAFKAQLQREVAKKLDEALQSPITKDAA